MDFRHGRFISKNARTRTLLVSASFLNEIGALCRMEIYPAQGAGFLIETVWV